MTYNTKKQAVRAAKEQGLDVNEVFEHEGKWILGTPMISELANENVATGDVVNPVPEWAQEDADKMDPDQDSETPVGEPIDPIGSADVGPAVIENEQVELVFPSDASKPFDIIWGFLRLNPTLSRKMQRVALVAYGLNENTVRTQISRYNRVGGDKSLLLSTEKAKRDAEKAHIQMLVAEIRAKREQEAAAAAAAPVEQEAPSE